MATQPSNDDRPAEIDFSKGVRDKFYKPGMHINTPVYLQDDVQAWLAQRAAAQGIEVEQLVNELLKKNIELIEAAK
ncbi:MAG: hypothetical protein ACRBC3_18390 [Burkholderiaceae bacterium]